MGRFAKSPLDTPPPERSERSTRFLMLIVGPNRIRSLVIGRSPVSQAIHYLRMYGAGQLTDGWDPKIRRPLRGTLF